MPDPINYMALVQKPDIARNIQAGLMLGEAYGQGVANENALARQKQYQQEAELALQNPTPEKFVALQMRYPEQAANAKSAWDQLSQSQRENDFSQGMQAWSALNSGQPQIATGMLDKQIAAYENSGKDTSNIKALKSMVESNPKLALGFLSNQLAAVDPEKFGKATEAATKSATQGANIEKAQAEAQIQQAEAAARPLKLAFENQNTAANIAKTYADMKREAKRLNLDTEKFNFEVLSKTRDFNYPALDDQAKKLINESAISAVSSEQSASKFNDLADKIQKAGGGGPISGSLTEWFKTVTGGQNDWTELRDEYQRLSTSGAMLAYKQQSSGATSDKDVDIAMSGVPPKTADADYVASYLRGIAKLNQLQSANESAKQQWINTNNSLGNLRRDAVIDGVTVPAGTSYAEFNRVYMPKRIEFLNAQQNPANNPAALKNRSYMSVLEQK